MLEKELSNQTFIAPDYQTLLRIDKFLFDRIPFISRSRIQKGIKSGLVAVNGEVVKANYKVHPMDEVVIQYIKSDRPATTVAEDIPLDIVYEDETLAIINKKPGMVIHPALGNYSGTLVNALLFHFKNLPVKDKEVDRPGIVHRLDKLTSGLMVVAKTEDALVHLSKQFADRTTDRRYVALVWGDLEEEAGKIEGNIGRSLKNRKVMSVFPEGDFGKVAITNYKVLKRYNYITAVECKLETGRTHQIRAHFKYLGHPLFNDMEYGGDRIMKGTTFSKYKQFINNCFEILPRQALHARSLTIDHPVTGERMHFESELPEDMKEVIKRWGNYIQNRDFR